MYYPDDDTVENPDELDPSLVTPDVTLETILSNAKAEREYLDSENKTGRPSSYKETFPQLLFEHYHIPFKRNTTINQKVSHSVRKIKVAKVMHLPTAAGFCRKHGINRAMFFRYLDQHQEFRDVYEWGKTVCEEMIVQMLLDGSYDASVAMLLAKITKKYDSEMLPIEESDQKALDDGLRVEETPQRVKGYDLSEIDKYCDEPAIETTATKVMDGEEKSVQVSQETKDI